MATNFPGSLDNSTSLPYPSATDDTNSPSLSGGQDNQNDAVIAAQTKLGTGASTPAGTNLLVSTGTGTSAWSKAAPVGTIVGTTDPQTLTNKTLTAPTLNTPTITNPSITGSIGNVSVGAVTATGLITGNAGLTITGPVTLPNNVVLSTTLALSSGFAGGVATVANSGNGGGTFFYVNLGGLKLVWCIGASVATSTAGNNYTFTLPSGFLSTVQFAIAGVTEQATFGGQTCSIDVFSTSSALVKAVSPSGNATCVLTLFMIGT